MVWTFKLRKGVKFNDDQLAIDTSRDVNAQDWVELADFAFGPETSRYRARFPEIDGPASWKAIDDYTLEVTLNRPTASFLYKLAIRGPQMYGLDGFKKRIAENKGIDLAEAMNDIDS